MIPLLLPPASSRVVALTPEEAGAVAGVLDLLLAEGVPTKWRPLLTAALRKIELAYPAEECQRRRVSHA